MFVYKLKIATALPCEGFQILIFYVVIACSFPFLMLLRDYALLIALDDITKDVRALQYSLAIAFFFSQVSRKSRHLRSSVAMVKMVVVGWGSYNPWKTTS